MLPSTCVVVPTYWTRAGAQPRTGDAVYDHPTALDGTSTLPPLLESLQKLDTSSFYLLLLVAVTGEDVAVHCEDCVRDLLAGYPAIVSLVFGPSHLKWLRQWLEEHRLSDATSFLDLKTYPRIRNLQLALPYALQSAAIVALDDDEIVVDPAFLQKATEPLGTQVNGTRVEGLSGHYLQEDGSILLRTDPAKEQSPNIFDRKAAIMNAATEKLESVPGNIVDTPFCFGGNMEFTPELAATVGFDPEITRGEDIDYLINARMEGKRFFLRKDLNILHRPPKGGSYKDTTSSKLEQDVIRFIYEEEKLKASQNSPDLHPVTAEELEPYPGDFLTGNIDDAARSALEQVGYQGDAAEFVRSVRAGAQDKVRRYLEFRPRWPVVLDAMAADSRVRDYLIQHFRGI